MQQTLNDTFCLRGIGLHSGQDITVTINPAPENHGIVFCRSDVTDLNNLIPASWDNVVDTTLCTVIGNEDGVIVKTVEHIMAALRGCQIDNALIDVNGAEVPSLDGSSQFFVREIQAVGTKEQSKPRKVLKILKEVTAEHNGKKAVLSPAYNSEFAGEIDYDHPLIGHQHYATTLVNGNFAHELASTRSFCLLEDVEKMKAMGLIKGGSLDNAVVIEGEKILNPDGLRFDDEFVRHKILDAVGDLYLAGGPILGAYYGVKCGHSINNRLLRAVFADDSNYEWVEQFVEHDPVISLTTFSPQNTKRVHKAVSVS